MVLLSTAAWERNYDNERSYKPGLRAELVERSREPLRTILLKDTRNEEETKVVLPVADSSVFAAAYSANLLTPEKRRQDHYALTIATFSSSAPSASRSNLPARETEVAALTPPITRHAQQQFSTYVNRPAVRKPQSYRTHKASYLAPQLNYGPIRGMYPIPGKIYSTEGNYNQGGYTRSLATGNYSGCK